MQLYNYRNKTIRLFEDKNIKPSKYYAYNAKSEPEKYDGAKKSEQEFDEGIGERVKLRRQKTDDKTGDEQLDTIDMPDLKSEESAKHSRKIKGQGLKILIPQPTLSRLPISLAQLIAGNNSEKLKNETIAFFVQIKKTKQNNL